MNIIEIDNAELRQPEFRFREPLTVSIPDQGAVAVVGYNGAGKSVLADVLTGRHPLLRVEPKYNFGADYSKMVSDNVKLITFRDAYGGNTSLDYYQQRWNRGVENETNSPTVEEMLLSIPNGRDFLSANGQLLEKLGVGDLLNKEAVMLSSGELRRFQLLCGLFNRPRLLIIDNPYIGLDSQARKEVSGILQQISEMGKTQIVLLVSRKQDIPPFISYVIPVEDMTVRPRILIDKYRSLYIKEEESRLSVADKAFIDSLPQPAETAADGSTIIELNNVSIAYDGKKILDKVNWQVRQGEKWALQGPNGAGKSTLLSLICADNPQSYACNISLFGIKRGSGESIWDIKRKIGYVSPEMFRAYRHNVVSLQVVASGMNPHGALYHRPSESEEQESLKWMQLFGIRSLADRNYLQLSSGEQRMILLCRAFVRNPELLVLDEPFHGLDDYRRKRAMLIIEQFVSRPKKSLIMVSHYEEDFPPSVTHRFVLHKNY